MIFAKKIATLTDWLKKAKAELNNPQSPNIADLLNAYYTARNAGAWSRNARIGNLKKFAEAFNYLIENQLFTLEDLEARVRASNEKTETVKASIKGKKAEHENDLKIFYITRWKLEKHVTHAGRIPTHAWRQELAKLQQEYKAEYERYKPMRDDLMKLLQVKNCTV